MPFPASPWLLAIVILVCFYLLHRSADVVISQVARLSKLLGLPQFFSGFVLLGIATSVPEIFIGLSSGLAGSPTLALGNLIGGFIILLTFVTGLTAYFSGGINFTRENHRHELLAVAALIVSPLLLFIDARLSHLDGWILLGLYSGYLLLLYFTRPAPPPPSIFSPHLWSTLLKFFLAITIVLGASHFLVRSALTLSGYLHILPFALGTIVLAIGSNLPEISVAISALRRRRPGLAVADILGSAAANTLVIACLGIFSPFTLSLSPSLIFSAGFILIAIIMFIVLTHRKNRLSRSSGLFLLIAYLLFLIIQLAYLGFLPYGTAGS